MRAVALETLTLLALIAIGGASRGADTTAILPPSQTALIAFAALLGPNGPEIELPLSWEVTRLDGTASDDDVVYNGGGAMVVTTLEPGRYVATASVQNASGQTEFSIEAGKDGIRDVVLDAGRLGLSAIAATGKETPFDSPTPSWTIVPEGGQAAVDPLQSDEPELVLAAGPYSITARSGPLAATTTLTLAAGATETRTLDFRAGPVRLEAALAKDGPALGSWPDAHWRVVALSAPGITAGETVQELDQAIAQTSLTAGSYRVVARVLGAELSADVTAVEKEPVTARVLIPQATLALDLAAGSTPPPQLSWTVAAVDALGTAAGTKAADAVTAPSPRLDLAPGTWSVSLTDGTRTVSREVTIGPGQTASERFDLGGGG